VRPFRLPGAEVKTTEKWTISKNGGVQPRWGHGGTELFYIALDGRLTAVPVRETADGGFEHGTPVALPVPAVPLVFGGGSALPSYAVPKDARRFLMTMLPLSPTSTPITVLLNWRPPQ
jgi:hypothetical protein